MWLVASLLDSGVLDLTLSLRSKATLGTQLTFLNSTSAFIIWVITHLTYPTVSLDIVR